MAKINSRKETKLINWGELYETYLSGIPLGIICENNSINKTTVYKNFKKLNLPLRNNTKEIRKRNNKFTKNKNTYNRLLVTLDKLNLSLENLEGYHGRYIKDGKGNYSGVQYEFKCLSCSRVFKHVFDSNLRCYSCQPYKNKPSETLSRWENSFNLFNCKFKDEYKTRYIKLKDGSRKERKYKFECLSCGNDYWGTINKTGCRCPLCYDKSSLPEQYIRKYIGSRGYYVLDKPTRDLISPYEIDIFIPELNIGFEYNGYGFHQEKENGNSWDKPVGYHDMKVNLCKDIGVDLFHLWENIAKDNLEELIIQVDEILDSYEKRRVAR